MTNTQARKAQTGEPTTNGGQFGSAVKAEAAEGLQASLSQRRDTYAQEQRGIANEAERNIARANLADFATFVQEHVPDAQTIRFSDDDDGDEIVWAELRDSDGNVVYDDVDAQGYLNQAPFDQMNNFVGQSFDVAAEAAWDPTGDCERHGGPWGDDETCVNCTFANGEPMPRS